MVLSIHYATLHVQQKQWAFRAIVLYSLGPGNSYLYANTPLCLALHGHVSNLGERQVVHAQYNGIA